MLPATNYTVSNSTPTFIEDHQLQYYFVSYNPADRLTHKHTEHHTMGDFNF